MIIWILDKLCPFIKPDDEPDGIGFFRGVMNGCWLIAIFWLVVSIIGTTILFIIFGFR